MGGFEKVVITGLMASGKSTAGRRLAERLGWPWRDSDVDIEAATGKTVRELRDSMGVDAMHDLEHGALLQALADPTPSVISAAASVIEDPDCRAAMTRPGVAVVWLSGSPEILAKRFRSPDDHRPSYGDSPEEFLADQIARREPLLGSIAARVVNVDDLTRDEVFERVVAVLG